MSKEFIISIVFASISLLISIITAFILVYDHFKFNLNKNKREYTIREIFKTIRIVYDYYSLLNPFLTHHINNNDKDNLITHRFKQQKIIHLSFINFSIDTILSEMRNHCHNINKYPYNIFNLYDSSILKYSSNKELVHIYNFWINIKQKIEYISKIISQYNYITKWTSEGIYNYNSNFPLINEISETSISLLPSFDEMKLNGSHSCSSSWNEQKVNNIILEYKKDNEEKLQKYKSEINSKKFLLSIKLESGISYTIYFNEDKIYKLEVFLNKENKEEIILEKTKNVCELFGINSDLLSETINIIGSSKNYWEIDIES